MFALATVALPRGQSDAMDLFQAGTGPSPGCRNSASAASRSAAGCLRHADHVRIPQGKGGKNIREKDALKHVAGYSAGIDFTARDLFFREDVIRIEADAVGAMEVVIQ